MTEVVEVENRSIAIGPHGHVLCRQCGREVLEISKEVSFDYAYCVDHRPKPQTPTEEIQTMTKRKTEEEKAANKAKRQVSIAQAKALKQERAAQAKADKAAQKATKAAKANDNGIPTHGKMAEFLALVKDAGGMTKDDIHKTAAKHHFKQPRRATRYCRQLGLLNEAKA